MQPQNIALRAAIYTILTIGTVALFLLIDANSHSASDTLRPFIIIAVPAWLIGTMAAKRLAEPKI